MIGMGSTLKGAFLKVRGREGHNLANGMFVVVILWRQVELARSCPAGRVLRNAVLVASGRGLLLTLVAIACSGVETQPLAVARSAVRRWGIGFGLAAWRYSWISPPSTSTRSIRRTLSMPAGVGCAGGTGTSRSMPRCGRAVL